jgi:ferredoxin-type protein NapH
VVESPRQRLGPADIRLRGGRGLQRTRRIVLSGSILLTILVPISWSLASHCQSAGVGAVPWWLETATTLGLCRGPDWIGAPWTLRAFGLEIMDPLAALSVLLAAGPTRSLLLGALPAVVLVAIMGRFFCGWLCPYLPLLSASNALRSLLGRLGLRPPDLSLPRHSARWLLLGWVALTAITRVQLVPLFYPPSIIGRELYRAVFQGSASWGLGLVFAAFAFDTLVSRAGFCRHLCPGGACFSILGKRSPIVVARTPARCTDCTVCDVVCNLGQSPMTDRLDSGCERCGRCIASCPTDALAFEIRSSLRVLSDREVKR